MTRYRITDKGRRALKDAQRREQALHVKPGMNSGPLYTMGIWMVFVVMVAMCVASLTG